MFQQFLGEERNKMSRTEKKYEQIEKIKKITILLLFIIFVSMLLLLITRSVEIAEAKKQKEELQNKILTGGVVDFQKLKQINTDVVGWIRIEALGIEEPFVRGMDNAYYLEHSIYKKKQMVGTIFMDYKNQTDFSNTNTILYGKNITSGLRLADLQTLLKEKKGENIQIEICLENRTLQYTVFASYLTKDIESIRGNRVIEQKEKQEFKEQLQENSDTDYEMPESRTGQMITLISYHNASHKNIVVHAIEIEKE